MISSLICIVNYNYLLNDMECLDIIGHIFHITHPRLKENNN